MACILVIDDSAFTRQMLAKALKAQGNEVLEAERHKPDCIVLDLLMPEISGFEVLKTLNEKGLTIPVVVLSADIQETTRAECLELGAVSFLKKPLPENELVEVVQGVLCSK